MEYKIPSWCVPLSLAFSSDPALHTLGHIISGRELLLNRAMSSGIPTLKKLTSIESEQPDLHHDS